MSPMPERGHVPKQHPALSPERWRSFDADEQLLMIANEMNRVRHSIDAGHEVSRRLGYERVLALTDLTIGVTQRKGLRRELLRWRDLAADMFCRPADPASHLTAMRALLLLSPRGAAQLRALGLA